MHRISGRSTIGAVVAIMLAFLVGCANPAATPAGNNQPPPIDSNNNRPVDVCRAYLIAKSKGDAKEAQALRSQFYRKKTEANPEAAAAELRDFQDWWERVTDSGKSQIVILPKETMLVKKSAGNSPSIWACEVALASRNGNTGSSDWFPIYAVLEDDMWRIAHRYEVDALEAAEQSNAADSR